MKNLLFGLFLAGTFLTSAQSPLNPYKYVIVPKKFETFKNENQYQTSTLIKFLLSQKGYNTVYEGDFPEDLASDRCLGVVAVLRDDSSMFTTKTSLVFEDCEGKEVFITKEGRSKEKDFKKSYSQAISDALQSLDGLEYQYRPRNKMTEEAPVTVSFKNDVKNVPEASAEEEASAPAKIDPRAVEQEATLEQQRFENSQPQPSTMKKVAPSGMDREEPVTVVPSETRGIEIWYAQELPNGYQLVDSSPKIRLRLLRTSQPEIYLAENGTNSGLVFKRGGKWFFEYYAGTDLKIEELNIKF